MLKPVRTPIPLPTLGAPRRPAKPAPPTSDGKACSTTKGLSGSSCELIAMKLKEEEKTNPNRRKVLERVVMPQTHVPQIHHWGEVRPIGGPEGFFCLAKDRFRVRVEGWRYDEIRLAQGWEFTDPDDCNGEIVIAVWSKRTPSHTMWGPAPRESGHENTYWVEYFGPNTGSLIRRAGPFGCTGDPVDHAKEDAGFSRPGVDGGYIILDSQDNVIETGGMG